MMPAPAAGTAVSLRPWRRTTDLHDMTDNPMESCREKGQHAAAPPRSGTTAMSTPFNFNRAVRRLRLRHFELLAILATEPSLRAVAARMVLTQPAVSKMLREIEETFGTALFERSRSGVVATPSGEYLVAYSRRVMNELLSVGKDVEAAEAGVSGTLRIGTFSGLLIIPAAIARLRRQEAGLRIKLREENSTSLMRALEVGEIDCVVGALPVELLDTVDRSQFSVETITSDHACVVASSRHVLAGKEHLGWSDLLGFAWALPRRETWLSRSLERVHLGAGLPPPIAAVELSAPSSLPDLLWHDDSLLGVMRSAKAREDQRTGRIIIIDVTPHAALPPVFFITLRTESSHSPIVRAFRATLAELLPS